MKTGRNEPCPCGSGLKYKKCCAKVVHLAQSDSAGSRRFQDREHEHRATLIQHAEEVFGPDAIHLAMREFFLARDFDFDRDELLGGVFLSWFLYCWEKDSDEPEIPSDAPEDTTIAESYLASAGDKLDPKARAILEAANRRPLSFLEVIGVGQGKRVRLKDLLTSEDLQICDEPLSSVAEPGDILFGSYMKIENRIIVLGMTFQGTAEDDKAEILEFRDDLFAPPLVDEISAETLSEYELEIREFLFDMIGDVPDEFGEVVEDPDGFETVLYQIDSAQQAFEAMKELGPREDESQWLDSALYTRKGELHTIDFPWVTEMEAPGEEETGWIVLGSFHIEGNRMSILVIDEDRVDQIMSLVADKLGEAAQFLGTETDPIDFIDDEMYDNRSEFIEMDSSGSNRIHELPLEAKWTAKTAVADHWKKWLDEPVPMLKNMTPRAAAQSEEGKILLEKLFEHFEEENGKAPDELCEVDVKRLRNELGMPF